MNRLGAGPDTGSPTPADGLAAVVVPPQTRKHTRRHTDTPTRTQVALSAGVFRRPSNFVFDDPFVDAAAASTPAKRKVRLGGSDRFGQKVRSGSARPGRRRGGAARVVCLRSTSAHDVVLGLSAKERRNLDVGRRGRVVDQFGIKQHAAGRDAPMYC